MGFPNPCVIVTTDEKKLHRFIGNSVFGSLYSSEWSPSLKPSGMFKKLFSPISTKINVVFCHLYKTFQSFVLTTLFLVLVAISSFHKPTPNENIKVGLYHFVIYCCYLLSFNFFLYNYVL